MVNLVLGNFHKSLSLINSLLDDTKNKVGRMSGFIVPMYGISFQSQSAMVICFNAKNELSSFKYGGDQFRFNGNIHQE